MILIHSPMVKPNEPPAGMAKLAGSLKRHGVKYTFVDANLEGMLYLLTRNGVRDLPPHGTDKWTSRATRHVESNIQSLRSWKCYENMDRYQRVVRDINRVLEASVPPGRVRLSLSNYLDQESSPLSSVDLMRVAETPEKNVFFPYFKERFLNLLEKEAPAVIGFSLNYLNQALCTFAMIGFLKRANPRLRIVLGGGLVTSWVRNPAWSNPFKELVDDLVSGPGETPLLSILGITNREGHDSPDEAILSGKGYLSPGTILPYSTSSGCYWNQCSFCPETAEGNPYRPLSTNRMTEELGALVAKTKPVLVHLLDNAASPAHLKAIVERPFGVPWHGFARISSHLADFDFCMALKRSGCVMLQLGVESGDQGVLDDMKKGFDLETASTVLRNLKKAGIATYVYLLFGTPSETVEKARKTLDFIVRRHDQIQFLNLAIFNLPAYGPDAQNLETGDFYEGDLSLYRSFIHPRGWNRHLVREFLNREFKKHPAMAPILRRTPPMFTSNHAPFFTEFPRP